MKSNEDKLMEKALEVAYAFYRENRIRSSNGLPGAIEVLEQAIRCRDDDNARQLLGLCFHKISSNEDALIHFNEAVRLNPSNADHYNNRALALSSLGHVDDAIRDINKAIELTGPRKEFFSNLAIQYRKIDDPDTSIEMLSKAIFLDDKDPDLWINLGGTYGEKHDLENAIKCFETAIDIRPDMATAHVDLAYSFHLDGQYTKAWKEYEHRFNCFSQLQFYNTKYDPSKRWVSPEQSVRNKTIILYCEQGFGDTIQFVRYLRILRTLSPKKVILHCQEALASLLKASHLDFDEIFTKPVVFVSPDEIPNHDLHASLLSLPYLLEVPLAVEAKYLHADKIDLGYEEYFKIGICWTGSPFHPNDRIRSCPLRNFKPLHDIPGVKLFSLQEDLRARKYHDSSQVIDYAESSNDMKIVDMREHMTDFSRTASIIQGLDLVVTVDTSILHLAGALGIPTIALLAFNPDWRWRLKESTTPWYNSVKLFRQEKRRDWETPMLQVRDHIVKEIHARNLSNQ